MRSLITPATFSTTGASILHGPHQGAQKSTKTGLSDPSTSVENVLCETSGSALIGQTDTSRLWDPRRRTPVSVVTPKAPQREVIGLGRPAALGRASACRAFKNPALRETARIRRLARRPDRDRPSPMPVFAICPARGIAAHRGRHQQGRGNLPRRGGYTAVTGSSPVISATRLVTCPRFAIAITSSPSASRCSRTPLV